VKFLDLVDLYRTRIVFALPKPVKVRPGTSLTRNLYDDIERDTRASVLRMDLAVESDTDELTV
jgi:hypothetical protein